MIAIQRMVQILRYLGPGWAAYRLRHAVEQRSGIFLRKLPVQAWSERPLSSFLTTPDLSIPEQYAAYRRGDAPRFFFLPEVREQSINLWSRWDREDAVITRAENILSGHFLLFSHHSVRTQVPPHWHQNPFTGQEINADQHWSRVSDFGHGDIKLVWELSRFSFVYDLVRAYWRSGNELYPEFFWQMLEDWHKHNPPQQGPQWKCGQETSFRVMAWIFGLYGFLDAPSSRPDRIVLLAQMIALSGERIAGHVEYALSQRNNHGISEGMGLWTIGLLFPEFASAHKWRERGRHILETLAQELIYSDGSFAQHSVNYHRVMLHDYLWSMQLGQLCGQPLSDELNCCVAKAFDLLYSLQDEHTGRTPLYGQNDGAQVLPLTDCDYLDFRPVLQAVNYLVRGERCYPPGPWDEALFWLFGTEALEASLVEKPRSDLAASKGGYFTMRTASGFMMTRCATYRDRPGQADMLHVDLWHKGINIAVDAGTYSYNASPPWNNALARTSYHNTVTVDDVDQMDRVSKFLWLPWLTSENTASAVSGSGYLAYWEGVHYGYQRLPDPVLHRRGVLRIGEDCWLIADRLTGNSPHSYRLHWLLEDTSFSWMQAEQRLDFDVKGTPFSLHMVARGIENIEASFVRADPGTPRGWRSPYYMDRKPALSVALEGMGTHSGFVTLICPASVEMHIAPESIVVQRPSASVEILLNDEWQGHIIPSVLFNGAIEEYFQIL